MPTSRSAAASSSRAAGTRRAGHYKLAAACAPARRTTGRPRARSAGSRRMTLYERSQVSRSRSAGYVLERVELDVSSGFTRVTTRVVLDGRRGEGRGEDVTYEAGDHDDYPRRRPGRRRSTLDERRPGSAAASICSRRSRQNASFPANTGAGPSRARRSISRFARPGPRSARPSAVRTIPFGSWSRRGSISALARARTPSSSSSSTRRASGNGDDDATSRATGRVRVLDFKAYLHGHDRRPGRRIRSSTGSAPSSSRTRCSRTRP